MKIRKHDNDIAHFCNSMNMVSGSPKVVELSEQHEKILTGLEQMEELAKDKDPQIRRAAKRLLRPAKAYLNNLRAQINEEMMRGKE